MKKVQYVGLSHYREFSAADWNSLQIEDMGKTVFDRDNRGGDGLHAKGKSLAQVHEVTDAAAEYLMSEYPGEFKVIEDEDAPVNPPSLSANPEGGSLDVPPPTRKIQDSPQA